MIERCTITAISIYRTKYFKFDYHAIIDYDVRKIIQVCKIDKFDKAKFRKCDTNTALSSVSQYRSFEIRFVSLKQVDGKLFVIVNCTKLI